jgi:hypothetical protein
MKKTIIVGNIEFLNRRAIIHSVEELYRANSKEEQEALEETFDNEGVDYLVIEEYLGELIVTNKVLVDLLEDNWGSITLQEGRLITNFDKDKAHIFKSAIREYRKIDRTCKLYIKDEAYDVLGRLVEDCNALHLVGEPSFFGLDKFWAIFDEIANNAKN